jgi:hypothetical protein
MCPDISEPDKIGVALSAGLVYLWDTVRSSDEKPRLLLRASCPHTEIIPRRSGDWNEFFRPPAYSGKNACGRR